MEKVKICTEKVCNEQDVSDSTENVQVGGTGQQTDPNSSGTGSIPEDFNPCDACVEHLSDYLDNVSNNIKNCSEQLTYMVQQADQLKAADRIIAQLSARCRTLSEQFYEREVLLPVIHSLIGIADRARQQIAKSKSVHDKYDDGQAESEAKILAYLVDGRNADLMELENALANLGVESYCRPQNTFDPATQKCINHVESEEEILNGRIARRLLPGYKRDNKIIRKECVNVYVVKKAIE
jgi:molecular chaperone GrpE (heat shock protein)